jgi:hypothetical protein
MFDVSIIETFTTKRLIAERMQAKHFQVILCRNESCKS